MKSFQSFGVAGKNTARIFLGLWLCTSLSAAPLDLLVQQLEEFRTNPEKRTLDYYELKNQRSAEKKQIIDQYETQNRGLKNVVRLIFRRIYREEIRSEKQDLLSSHPSLPLETILEGFQAFQKSGGALQTGDLVAILPVKGHSLQIAKYSDSTYSHGGLIWLQNEIPYVLEVNPRADLFLVPLADYVAPYAPQNAKIGLYRFKTPIPESAWIPYFTAIMAHRDKIGFDALYHNDPPIQNLEDYFKSDRFLYCTEFVTLSYQYLSGKNNFLSPYRLNTRKVFERFAPEKKSFIPLLDKLDAADNQGSQFLICFNNITQSKEFELILEIG